MNQNQTLDSTISILNSDAERIIFQYSYLLIIFSALIGFSVAIILIMMVYCCFKRQTNSKSSNDLNAKHKLQEICIIPVSKPLTNESKPQLNVDSKLKSKTLIESKTLYKKRRGSSNSLTLTIDPIKKKLSINSPTIECPSSMDLTKASNLLTLNELIKISSQFNGLYNEFYNIPTNHPEMIVLGSGIKNRYKTIIPNEITRVKLPIRNNDIFSEYINANYVTGYCNESKAYIAAQGPMSNTLNDFWYMIWNERVTCIVMITKLIERNKPKCEMYIPEVCDESISYGEIAVTVVNITYQLEYEIREINIKFNNQIRTVFHYWYTTWPDQNVPDNPNALIQLIKQVESCHESFNDSIKNLPILVHCSAGIGRTGCYIAISNGIKQIESENMIDLMQIVSHMRHDRGGMIQTLEQYEFVYQCLAYYCIYYKNCYSNSPKSPFTQQSFTFNTPTIQ